MEKEKNSDQRNKQERDRNPPYKQDNVLLFTVNKDNWPIRREYLSHMTIICRSPAYNRNSAFKLRLVRYRRGVLNYDTFFHHVELQNILRKINLRLLQILPQNAGSPARLVF